MAALNLNDTLRMASIWQVHFLHFHYSVFSLRLAPALSRRC
jgi:hypothetical protein